MNQNAREQQQEFHGTTIWSVAKEFLFRARRSPADSVRLFLGETIWRWDTANMSPVNRRAVLFLRMLYLVGRRFVSARAQRQAMALTYTTMLALVPAFAIMVAVFSMRGLGGMKMRLQTFAIEALAASPDQERLLTQWLNDLVSNMQGTGGVAGVAFFVFLFFTIVSLLSTLEKTLNDVWAVKRHRPFINKFVTYWCIATLGPVCLGLALVQGANLERQYADVRAWGQTIGSRWVADSEEGEEGDEPEDEAGFAFPGVGGEFAAEFEAAQSEPTSEGTAEPVDALETITWGTQDAGADYASMLIALGLTIITFTLLYAFLPNTRVRLKPALYGAIVAAILWTAAKWGLALSSATLVRYNTVYGSLATIPITMFWLYLTWLLVILGAEVSFALQNVRSQRREELATDTTQLFKERVALRLVAQVARAFEKGDTPPTHETLEDLTGAPLSLCQSLLFHLTEDGLLREIDKGKQELVGYVPARPLDTITISDVIDSLRERRGISFDLAQGPDLPVLERQLARANQASKALAGQVTLRQLATSIETGAEVVPAPPKVFVVAESAIKGATSTNLRGDAVRAAAEAAAQAASAEPATPESVTPVSASTSASPEGEEL